MTGSSAEQVLSVDGDSVGTFIANHARARTLSGLMRDLNDALISGDDTARAAAERAIRHLGFPVDHSL